MVKLFFIYYNCTVLTIKRYYYEAEQSIFSM